MSDFTAVVTGASQGIGAEMARRLLDRGYTVINVSLNTAEFDHDRLVNRPCDLLDADAVSETAQAIAKDHAVTHLINNAGLMWPNLVEDAKAEDITGLAQLQLGSSLTLLQAFLPEMKKRKFGRVLFNSSRAALGAPTRTAYSAVKAGILGMARTWALELAPSGITVNVVSPGPTLTDNFWAVIPKGSDQETDMAKRIPVGRIGTVEDVANAFLFFCDPASSFVTGQNLYVCGGTSIGSFSI